MKSILELYGINPYDSTGKLRTPDQDDILKTALGTNIDKSIKPTSYMREAPKSSATFSWQQNLEIFFSDWQKEIYRNMIKGNNTIVSVPPAAGKSMPFLASFFVQFNRFINKYEFDGLSRPDCPRILYIAPTKQLCTEFYGDIKNHGLEIILKYLENKIKKGEEAFGFQQPDILRIVNNKGRLTPVDERQIYTILNDLVSIQTGGYEDSNMQSRFYGLKPMVISTYKPAEQITRKYGRYYNNVFIDEFQEFIAHPGQSLTENDDLSKVDSMLSIILRLPMTSKVHLMTGSVNSKSINIIKTILNNISNRDFRLLEFGPNKIPSTKNRSHLTVVPFDKMMTLEEKVNKVVELVNADKPYNLIVTFATKSTSPSGLFNILQNAIPRLPKMREQELFSGVESTKDLVDIPKNPNDKWFKLFLTKQKDYINKHITRTPEAIIEPFVIPNVVGRGSLQLERTHFDRTTSKNYYTGYCSSGTFYRHEENCYIYFRDDDSINLFKIISINPDYTINLELVSSDWLKGIKNKDVSRKLTYDIEEGQWMIIDKEIDNNPTIDDSLNRFINDNLTENDKNQIQQKYVTRTGSERLKKVNDIEFLKYFDHTLIDRKKSGGDSKENELKDEDIVKYYNPDNLLYQGALRGIGVMFGGLHDRHKSIIQSLFRQGKLKVLLATDAVGVGANVNVRNLYLTTLDKFSDGAFRQVDSSSIVQIINRAGRKSDKFPQAYIYVPSQHVDYITKLVENDPSSEVEEISIDFMELLKDRALDQKSKLKIQNRAWQSAMDKLRELKKS